MRPFILVGIENTQRRRDMTGPTTNAEDKKIAPKVGGSATFRQFIRTELMPEITRRYRTTPEKAIVGESLAGLFVLETMVLEPALFDTYVAIDPSIWWNNEQLVNHAGGLQLQEGSAPKTLYVATSSDAQGAAAQRLDQTMRAKAGRALKWYYAPMPQETHATIYHPAALQAFRTVFKPQPVAKPAGH
jgi:predicted alpha/beta superfamily hydrolase